MKPSTRNRANAQAKAERRLPEAPVSKYAAKGAPPLTLAEEERLRRAMQRRGR